MPSNSFSKQERLKHKKAIDALFENGKSANTYPLRIVWKSYPEDTLPKIAFSVSKKRFRRAVDRNSVKRLLRESYRLCKQPLTDSLHVQNKTIHGIFIYTGKVILPYAELERKMKKVLAMTIKKEQQT